jgi:hypothetical protein
MPKLFLGCVVAALALPLGAQTKPAVGGVQVIPDLEQRRVDITIDGSPFTSYVWPTTLKKPVLYPLIAQGGIEVTRGFPLAPRSGERVDHPHHAGMWFNYGNANGFDFWNNSDAIKPEDRGKMGTITHEKIVSAKSGPDQGELIAESSWITGANREILRETTRYVFTRRGNARIIDQITTLQALDQVVFHDDKEGLLGLRVARWLESPDEKGGMFTDASGRGTSVPTMTMAGATGVYLTSEGKKGDQAWGTRGRWCALTGSDGRNELTLAILGGSKPAFNCKVEIKRSQFMSCFPYVKIMVFVACPSHREETFSLI